MGIQTDAVLVHNLGYGATDTWVKSGLRGGMKWIGELDITIRDYSAKWGIGGCGLSATPPEFYGDHGQPVGIQIDPFFVASRG